MIKIDKITIKEFRGIRSLTLDLKGQNFAACGPNGTGKSGIVDAIEFAVTGNISRLTGRGTGGLSVSKHGPHVDFQNKPEQSSVTLDVSITSLKGKKATIHRTVKAAAEPKITPSDADVLAALDDAKLHPEFVLSRRELIRYVISEPGDRAKEVQTLLRLDDIEKLRVVLQKISNAYTKELPPLERAEREAVKHLAAVLGISELTKPGLLGVVNSRRAVLALAPLPDLMPTTSLTDGLATTASGFPVQRIAKAQAQADIAALKDAIETLKGDGFAEACANLIAPVSELVLDPQSASGVKREALLNSALELYDDEACPVCDTALKPESFTTHVKEKLAQLDEISVKRKALESSLAPILESVQAADTVLTTVIAYGPFFKPAVDMKLLGDFKQVLRGRYGQLQKLLPLTDTLSVLEVANQTPDFAETFAQIDAALAEIPEPTATDAARDFLTISQERLDNFRQARQNFAAGKARADRAAKVFKVFADTTTKAPELMYKDVQDPSAA